MKTTTKTRDQATKTKAASSTRKRVSAPKTEASAEETVAPAHRGHDEVAEIAYFIYQHRIANGIPGDSIADWLAAEAEVLDQSEVALAG